MQADNGGDVEVEGQAERCDEQDAEDYEVLFRSAARLRVERVRWFQESVCERFDTPASEDCARRSRIASLMLAAVTVCSFGTIHGWISGTQLAPRRRRMDAAVICSARSTSKDHYRGDFSNAIGWEYKLQDRRANRSLWQVERNQAPRGSTGRNGIRGNLCAQHFEQSLPIALDPRRLAHQLAFGQRIKRTRACAANEG